MRTLAFALIGLLSPFARAQDPPALKLPAEVRAAPAAIAELRVETSGKAVEWICLTPGLSIKPTDGGKVLFFSGPTGRYELIAYTAVGDVPSKPARVVVIIGTPEPPKPDLIAERVKKAFADDPSESALKSKHAKALAALYRELAKEAADAGIASPAEFRRVAKEASAKMIGPDALVGVRGLVAAELALLLPTDEAFTDQQRAAAARLFEKLAATLEGL